MNKNIKQELRNVATEYQMIGEAPSNEEQLLKKYGKDPDEFYMDNALIESLKAKEQCCWYKSVRPLYKDYEVMLIKNPMIWERYEKGGKSWVVRPQPKSLGKLSKLKANSSYVPEAKTGRWSED